MQVEQTIDAWCGITTEFSMFGCFENPCFSLLNNMFAKL